MQQDILKEDRENGIVNVKELLHTYIRTCKWHSYKTSQSSGVTMVCAKGSTYCTIQTFTKSKNINYPHCDTTSPNLACENYEVERQRHNKQINYT